MILLGFCFGQFKELLVLGAMQLDVADHVSRQPAIGTDNEPNPYLQKCVSDMGDNYVDNHIDEIRQEFKLLDHWIYLNAADQMIPGNYWLTAVRDFYNFVEYGRM